MSPREVSPEEKVIVGKAAAEIERLSRNSDRGLLCNLGIGIPTLIPAVLPKGLPIHFHSENGFVGMGAPLGTGTPDNDVIDAGGRAVLLNEGAACFDSLASFMIVRSGRLDVAVLGAFEVALNGDLANWVIPGKLTPGMGGGMELAQKAKQTVVVSRHLDKYGSGKLKKVCTLPLTAKGCVSTLITERAMFRRIDNELQLVSLAPHVDEQQAREGMPEELKIASNLEAW